MDRMNRDHGGANDNRESGLSWKVAVPGEAKASLEAQTQWNPTYPGLVDWLVLLCLGARSAGDRASGGES